MLFCCVVCGHFLWMEFVEIDVCVCACSCLVSLFSW